MLILLLSLAAQANEVVSSSHAVVRIEGMDCAGCEAGLVRAFEALDPVGAASVSYAQGLACLTLTSPADTAKLTAIVTDAGFRVAAVESVAACPKAEGHGKSVWANPGQLDVVTISTGEEVDPKAHLAAGKYTIVDFGAPWCGPCHTSASRIAEYMESKGDVAVRAIELVARDARASFALPAAKQHLQMASGLPWFVVYDAAGKSVYKGGDVEAALAAIDKKRSK